jgi:hypothetical protein
MATWTQARDRRLVLLAGLAAALPVVVAVIQALQDRWVPLADNGVIVLRSWDVLTDQSPLVGQFSTAKQEAVGDVYSPGPLLYWLLALPVRLLGPDGVPLAMGALNVASIMGTVALARRRAGIAFMLVTAAALALTWRSLPPDLLFTPFNPTAPLIPCTLLIFLAWSLACGELRLLPVTALVASFVMQAHLAYVVPAVAMLTVAAAGLVIAKRRGELSPPSGGRRWALAALLVLAVSWSAPLIDEVVHEPGNLTMLRRTFSADRATLGSDAAWHAIVQAFGVPPWWLESRADNASRFTDIAVSPSRPSILAFLALVGLLGLALLNWRRVTEASAAVLGLVLVAALAAVAAATPTERVITVGYTMLWGSPAGMFAWLAAGLGLLGLLAGARRRYLPKLGPFAASRAAPAAGLALTALVAIWAAGTDSPKPNRWIYAPARALVDELEAAVPPGRSVFVRPSTGELGYKAYPLIVYALRRNGDRPLVVPQSVESMGGWYGVTGRRYDTSVAVLEGEAALPAGGRIVARIPVDEGPDGGTERPLRLVLIPE